MIETPINATLPATGAGAALITLGAAQDCTDYLVQARGSVDMKISDTLALTKYYTLKSGTAISLSQALGKASNMFYAESGGAADTVEVLIKRT